MQIVLPEPFNPPEPAAGEAAYRFFLASVPQAEQAYQNMKAAIRVKGWQQTWLGMVEAQPMTPRLKEVWAALCIRAAREIQAEAVAQN